MTEWLEDYGVGLAFFIALGLWPVSIRLLTNLFEWLDAREAAKKRSEH